MPMKIVAWLTHAGTPNARVDLEDRMPGSRLDPSTALVTMEDAHRRIEAAIADALAVERERVRAVIEAFPHWLGQQAKRDLLAALYGPNAKAIRPLPALED
jgi:hypothetical protein